MKIVMLDMLTPGLHSFRCWQTSPPGVKPKTYKSEEYIATPSGEMTETEWINAVRDAIHLQGGDQLLSEIKTHCRKHCPWLREGKDLEQYAMECMLTKAYEYWKPDPGEQFSEYPHKIGFIFDKYDKEDYHGILS